MPSPTTQTLRASRLAKLLYQQGSYASVPSLTDRSWKLKYSQEDGNLVSLFYVPALECAVHYDRATGYFGADALTLAMRGIEGLVRNSGSMRLLVGCTLKEAEVDAINRGEALRDVVDAHLAARPLEAPDEVTKEALELLAWMIAQGILDVKVAIPCDEQRRPRTSEGIFHQKAGIIQDAAGNQLVFSGSLNETRSGWVRNAESFHAFPNWTGSAPHAAEEIAAFATLWANKSQHVVTIDVPAATKADLLRFLPESDLPARLATHPSPPDTDTPLVELDPLTTPAVITDTRQAVWDYIAAAPALLDGGALVGEATCAVDPWPHQIRAYERMYAQTAPRLLIADEVGLGKTIQAGMLLRQMWLAGRARRILILTPASVMRQWQIELRDKFNLNWPVYDNGRLNWYPSPAMAGAAQQEVGRAEWHQEDVVIASSHLMRRKDRERELCEDAEPWDLIVLDEAHHARRKGAGSAAEEGPNALLKLMRRLRDRTQGLVMLTATPMQVHPIEVWDLLDLLGIPASWGSGDFLRFFNLIGKPSPSHTEFDELAAMFRAAEVAYGKAEPGVMKRLGITSKLRERKILEALRDHADIPRRALDTDNRKAAIRLMRAATPVSRLVSRHTRELLRRYYKAGKISTPIADRRVEDEFITLSREERTAYEAMENYISTTYNQASPDAKNAVGFVMTVYRRRLASSFRALRQTLENRFAKISGNTSPSNNTSLLDDVSDDESRDEVMDADDVARLEHVALKQEEGRDIEALLRRVATLPVDSKAVKLTKILESLRNDGYAQAMVFTQFTDTMDFLRRYLVAEGTGRILCFSGRGGETLDTAGQWRSISRDEVKRRFREGSAEVLLCTDAAAEGLNFQFCGALVNYDMPWNPMRAEQRIGRIDRLGQKHAVIRIVNLHYRDTVESDVYMALRKRIGLFESVVGRLQPILAQLPRAIGNAVLHGGADSEDSRQRVASDVMRSIAALQNEPSGLDLDAIADDDLEMPDRGHPALDLEQLDRVICRPALMPPATEIRALGPREYAYLAPGMRKELRVTTDPVYFEQHADAMELWSPGSPVFPKVEDPEGRPESTPAIFLR